MNIVYLLGIVLAFVFVIFGITFDPGGTGGLMVGPFNLDTLINFVDPTSILIVLGGSGRRSPTPPPDGGKAAENSMPDTATSRERCAATSGTGI